MQQLDSRGKPLSGARLFIFDGGTTTPRIGYKDSSLVSAHPNPILADASGRLPLIYLEDGFYRHRLTTKSGTPIFDDDGLPVLSSTSGGSGTSVDPDSVFKTRDLKIRFDDQPLAGYVRLNGRTIGSAGSGATERANADTQSLYEELWDFSNIAVTGGKGASAAADYAANKPLVLPDMAGRLIAGLDDLGAGAKSVLTTAVVGMDPTLPGSYGGAQSITIQNAYLPVTSAWTATASTTGATSTSADHAHAITGNTQGFSATHHHDYDVPSGKTASTQSGGGAGLNNIWTGTGTGGTTDASADHTHAINFASANAGAHSHTLSATTTVTMQSNVGGGQAMNKLSPIMTFMIYLRL